MTILPPPQVTPCLAQTPEERKCEADRISLMFGSIAHRYDLLNHLLSFGVDFYWRRKVARELRNVLAQPQCKILDLCAGTGDLSLTLKKKTTGNVLAADFCHPMLRIARKKFLRANLAIPAIEADALELPFASKSFDMVTLAFGLRNLLNHKLALFEIRRVLKPGGKVAILEFSQPQGGLFGLIFGLYFRFLLPRLGGLISGVREPYQYLPDSVSRFPSKESLSQTIRECGFTSVTYRNLTGGIAALYFGNRST